ncbi:copper resistance protein CopC [Micrococcaceae bacterium Sec5.7]
MNPRPARAPRLRTARRVRASLPRAAALFLTLAGILLASLLGGAAPASAHSNLLFTSPASDSTVATAPETLTLLFDEPVSISGTAVKLTGPGDIAVGTAALSHGNRALELPVHGAVDQGIYTVTWQVTAQDGDVMGGSYRYAAGPVTAGLGGGQATDTQGSWPTGVLRGILFAALAAALGEPAATLLLRRIQAAPPRPRSWLPFSAFLGLGACLGLAVLLLGNGSLTAGLTRPDPAVLLSTRPGALAMVETAGFALAAAAKLIRRPGWAWAPLAAVVAAEALRAHPQLANPVIGIPLTLIHLAAAALWAGTLFHVLRTAVAWRHQRPLARAAIAAYSRPALWLVITVAITGLASGLLLIPLKDITTTDYGRALLIKTGLVTAAAVLALAARRHLRRKATPERISRPARVEAVSLVGVLGISALLTVLPLPGSADAPLAFPPPATGPVVPMASLAGEIGVSARASAGQLVVQLVAPEFSDGSGPINDAKFSLTGAIADPDGQTQDLKFRGCGTGCFFTPVTWKDGSSLLSVSPVAGGWRTDRAGLTVAWPPAPAADLLTAAVTAMKAVPSFTLHELVTSDTTQGLGTPMSFEATGADFVRRALYASGTATLTARLPDLDGHRRLTLSYPAENALLELTLADDGRILHETLTAPHHLVTRTLIYPEPR